MQWFNNISGGANGLIKKGLKISIISNIFMVFILLVSFVWLNCDKELAKLVAPDESEFPGSPINLKVVIDDQNIIISWQMSDTTAIHCYHIYRADSIDTKKQLIDSTFVMKYVDRNVINGKIYYYHVVAVNNKGYEGKPSEQVSARANLFNVMIQNGDEYTNNRAVTLQLTAPLGTTLMLIGNDSLFTNSSWEYFKVTKEWTLPPGDGLKYVYAKFRDSEGNESKSPIHDKIILDTQAVISELSENTNGQVKSPGDIIHFKMVTGESDGEATVDIGTQKKGIKLYDDGTNGDVTAQDGNYEANYLVPADLEVINSIIVGHFTDRANNVATDVTATGRITIQLPPSAVTLADPAVAGNSLELMWSQNHDSDFKSYRLFRSTTPGVDINSDLLTTKTNRTETSYLDTDVKEDSTYYYVVFVYDNFGLMTASNEVWGGININQPPTAVNLLPPTPLANSTTSLHLSWSKNEDYDFASYKIYRSDTAGVSNTSSSLVQAITQQGTTSYDDTNLKEDTEYYYRVYVYDNGGLFAASNEEKGRTNNDPPTPVRLSDPVVIDSVTLRLNWTKNEDDDFKMYQIYRSETSPVSNADSLVTTIYLRGTTEYEDTNLVTNTTYYYRVYVTDRGGLSSESDEVTGTPKL